MIPFPTHPQASSGSHLAGCLQVHEVSRPEPFGARRCRGNYFVPGDVGMTARPGWGPSPWRGVCPLVLQQGSCALVQQSLGTSLGTPPSHSVTLWAAHRRNKTKTKTLGRLRQFLWLAGKSPPCHVHQPRSLTSALGENPGMFSSSSCCLDQHRDLPKGCRRRTRPSPFPDLVSERREAPAQTSACLSAR